MLKYVMGAAVIALVATSMPAVCADAPTVVRTLLKDGPAPGGNVETMMKVVIPPGGNEGRHFHSGPLIVTVISGVFSLDYEGKPTTDYKAGDTFYVEAGKQHEGHNRGKVDAVGIATFVTPKGAPLTTQVADKDVKK